jgi:hypothetical protein
MFCLNGFFAVVGYFIVCLLLLIYLPVFLFSFNSREGGRFAKQAPDPNNPNGSAKKKSKATPARVNSATMALNPNENVAQANAAPHGAPNHTLAHPMANYLELPHWAQLRDYKPQYTFNKGVYSFNAYNSYNSLSHFPPQPPMNVSNNSGNMIANNLISGMYSPNNTNNSSNHINLDNINNNHTVEMAGNVMVVEDSLGNLKDGANNSRNNNSSSNNSNNGNFSYPFLDPTAVKHSTNNYSYPFVKIEHK